MVLALLLVLLLPVAVILPLRWLAPPTSSFMATHDGPVAQVWADANELSPWLAIAAVAAEDQLFPRHRGFDTASLKQALDDHLSGRRTRGASTISQQVAKNLFLWSGQSWLRKGMEAWLTVYLEVLWPKQRILEVYLNIAEFGPDVYGAEAASRRYFGKAAAALTLEEATLLVAVLPSPKTMSVTAPSPYLRERAAWIGRQVGQLGGPGYLRACCPQLSGAGD